MLWIDAESDVLLMSTKSSVQTILDKCKDSGINTIALDIKPYSGYVLYNSKIAPKITSFKGLPYPENFDLLKTVIQEARKRKMKVHAALNIFSEGLKAEKIGPVFAHPEWESVIYDVSNYIRTTTAEDYLISEYNQKSSDHSMVIFNTDYGKKYFPRDIPENAIDENTVSSSSRWISNVDTTPHWLMLEWSTPQKLDTVTLHFVKNYIIPKYKLQYSNNGKWIDLVSIDNNIQIRSTHSFSPVIARKLRLFIEDSGIDSVARITEIEVYSIQGGTEENNIATLADIYADSVIERGHSYKIFQIKNDKIVDILEDKDIQKEGIPISKNSYILVTDGKASRWADSVLSIGTPVKVITQSRLITESQFPSGMLVYVNPNHPKVRERALSIIKEVTNNYDIDGIILDRVRYDNFHTDFSELSHRQFESFIGETIKRWPEDIYEMDLTPRGIKIIEGKYYKEWIYWRSSIIKDFIEEAKRVVKETKPEVEFGDYVGGWYPTYYEMGVNWASTNYDPSEEYNWATPAYRGTGYADSLDYLCPGLYYPELTISEAMAVGKKDFASLEGGIQMIKRVVGDSTRIYASLYYPNIAPTDRFKKAVRMCLDKTDGVMIFSMIHIEKGNKWPLLKESLTDKSLQDSSKLNKSIKKSSYISQKRKINLD